MPQVTANDGFAPRLAGYYMTLGAATGFGMPYFPLWLENRGLDATEIGIVLAMPMVVRIVFVPLVTRLADGANRLRATIIVTSIFAAIGNAAFALVDSFVPILIVIVLAAIFYTPSYPLTDAYALRGLAERKRSYGPVRLWSSAAYIAANFGGGLVIGHIGRANILWLIVSAFGVGIACAVLLRPLAAHRAADSAGARPSSWVLWRSPAFVAVVVACSLVQAAHAVYYGFSTLDWTAKGLSDPAIGALWGLGVVAEIGFFMIANFVGELIGPMGIILLGAGGAVLRWGAMAFDPPVVLLPLLQCLHGLSYGAAHIGAMQFLARTTPAGLGATAQGDFVAVQGLIYAVAMGLSGVLFHAYGDLAYLAMAFLAAVGLAVAIVAFLRWRDPRS